MPTGQRLRIFPAGGLLVWHRTGITLLGEKQRYYESDIDEICALVLKTLDRAAMYVVVKCDTLGQRRRYLLHQRIRLRLMREGHIIHGRQIHDLLFMWATRPPVTDRSQERRRWRKRRRAAARRLLLGGSASTRRRTSTSSAGRSRCA